MKVLLSFPVVFPLHGTASFSRIRQPNLEIKFGNGLRIKAAEASIHFKTIFPFQNLFQSQGDLKDNSEWESNFVIRRTRLKFAAENENFPGISEPLNQSI